MFSTIHESRTVHINFFQLFNRINDFYIVPESHRQYCWETKHLEDFLESISLSKNCLNLCHIGRTVAVYLTKDKIAKFEDFLGFPIESCALNNSNVKFFELSDGQNRLITSLLLFKAIGLLMSYYGNLLNDENMKNNSKYSIYKKCIKEIDVGTEKIDLIPIIPMNPAVYNLLKKIMTLQSVDEFECAKKKWDSELETRQEIRIYMAFKFLFDKVNAHVEKNQDIKCEINLWYNAIEKLQFAMTFSNQMDFITEREFGLGVPLNDMDKLKNYLRILEFNAQLWTPVVNKMWIPIGKLFDRFDFQSLADDFLNIFWDLVHPNHNAYNVLEDIKIRFGKVERSDLREMIVGLLTSIQKSLKIIDDILYSKDEEDEDEDEEKEEDNEKEWRMLCNEILYSKYHFIKNLKHLIGLDNRSQMIPVMKKIIKDISNESKLKRKRNDNDMHPCPKRIKC